MKAEEVLLDWLESIDVQSKARIQARVFRFEIGNLGDYKVIGDGVYETRFDFGPGYRVYFGIDNTRLILKDQDRKPKSITGH